MKNANALALYRAIMRELSRYPSRKRERLMADARADFKTGAKETDAEKAKAMVEEATTYLASIRKHSKLGTNRWDVGLGHGQ